MTHFSLQYLALGFYVLSFLTFLQSRLLDKNFFFFFFCNLEIKFVYTLSFSERTSQSDVYVLFKGKSIWSWNKTVTDLLQFEFC